MQRWPELFLVMRIVYLSLGVQIAAVVLLLGFTAQLAWLRTYVLAFVFAALATIAISALIPAEGVWLHYGFASGPAAMPVSQSSWPVFFGLRDGSVRTLMAVGSEGIITFPSLHAALAVILALAFWPVPIVRWFAAATNSLMLAATPIDGSHYFVDVIGGVVIAVLCWAAARVLVTRLAISSVSAGDKMLNARAGAYGYP